MCGFGEYLHRQRIEELVALSHALAVTALRRRKFDGSMKDITMGLDCTDLAYDCIAEIFHRDRDGNLLQLQAYFRSFPIEELSNQTLLSHLRRLIASKVNDSMFRAYGEFDPSLSKIIRNIKLAIDTLHNFTMEDRFGESFLVPLDCVRDTKLPIGGYEEVMRELAFVGRSTDSVPRLLSKLSLWLHQQTMYRKALPLMTIAPAFRSVYTIRDASEGGEKMDASLFTEDALIIVEAVCKEIHQEMLEWYVKRKGCDPVVFAAYFLAIEHSLRQSIIESMPNAVPLYDCLRPHLVALTKDEYRKEHRKILEYLTRMCRQRLQERLKEGDLLSMQSGQSAGRSPTAGKKEIEEVYEMLG
jgi:hypothetical protein